MQVHREGGRAVIYRAVSSIVVATAFVILSTGCSTSNHPAKRTSVSTYPIRENRMSTQSQTGYLASGVWRIRGLQNTVYLAGTSHEIADDQIPLPSPYYAAYRDSKAIYVEFNTDMSWFTKLRLVPKVLKWAISHRAELSCPKGRNLANYLSAGTVERLRAFYGKDYPKHERMTPLALVLFADIVGAGKGGVEDIFTLQGRKDGKPIRELDDQAIVATALLLMDEMVAKLSLDIARRGADAVVEEFILGDGDDDEIDTAWRRGDMAAVEHEQAQIKQEFPTFYEKLLPERNRKWLPKLKLALQGKKNAMVLVGVAHLGGKEGLLQMSQEAGFKPEQLYGVDRPD
jgi:uncharacterized protein YbaP (TraB family)